MSYHRLRWTAIAVAVALFGAAELITTLFAPRGGRGAALIPLVIGAVAVVGLLPAVLGAYERQEERIERQKRELETLHALDTAIVRELDIPRLLETATLRVLRTLDAEIAGIVLVNTDGSLGGEFFAAPSRTPQDTENFTAMVRAGTQNKARREVVIVPIGEKNTENEHPLGFVGAGRFPPSRPFVPEDFGMLAALSDTIAVAVANARALEKAREMARMEEALVREQRVVRAFVEGMLPEIPTRVGNWGLSVCYEPQSAEAPVGGDIYDVFALDSDRWGVVIADVSGKGLAAARQTAVVKYALRSYAREHASPARVLTLLNDTLCDEPSLIGFVTVFYGVLESTANEGEGTFTYASAGHEPPFARRIGGAYEPLPPTGIVLGAQHNRTFEERRIQLAPGEGVLLYTDGFSEARNRSGAFLETEGVIRLLQEQQETKPEQMTPALLAALRAYTGGKLRDDTALLWIERLNA